ncbi:uncharacterized protein LOC106664633 isoform X2 [Cimex lectularius]|nr:uncharacterized protein LOC106664633 isoform X2 [Cimex lectularius]XP_014246032.1 uncharacterized protein LOC106664633 isoform X2 [Cimex lectularius]
MATSYPVARNANDTGLHKIEFTPKDPFQLVQKWYDEFETDNYIAKNSFCLSTAAKSGRVSARNLILRRLDKDGFVIMTDSRSKKVREMEENPMAAMTFLWVVQQNELVLSRQVRAEGLIKRLPYEEWKDIYDNEPLFAKIRAYLCYQGQEVDWDEARQEHDKIYNKFQAGNLDLSVKPDHVVAYKMKPDMLEFYESLGPRIADRVMYLMGELGWKEPRRIWA